MSQQLWSDVDAYFGNHLIESDEVMEAAQRDAKAAGLPAIQVSPAQGKFLHLLARIHGSRRILEIGTLAGYSAIWLARALPKDGKLITLEAAPKHAQIAKKNIARAGLAERIEIIEGPAMATLAKLANEKSGPFDLIFIDADKENTAEYFTWSVKLSRPGTVIVVDNVVRKGEVANSKSQDVDVQGIRRFTERLAAEKRATATAIQTVGSKGYDGFAIVLVTE